MATVIGNLRVSLGIDSAQFQAGLARAQVGMERFASQAKVAFAAVAVAATVASSALAVGIKRTIDEADDFGKSAQKFGVGVEELSRLKYAADLAGVSFESLGAGLRILSKNMLDAASGAKNVASNAFAALGISVKNADGSLKSASEVMTEVAGKLAGMQDGAAKTAATMALFGKSGADLIPMLNGGADGLRKMAQEADRLGVVIDTNTAQAAEAFNDNLTRLSKVKDGLILRITERLLPSLELLSERFVALVSDGELVKDIADKIGGVFDWVAKQSAYLALAVQQLSVEFSALGKAINLVKAGEFTAAWDAFRKGQEESARLFDEGRKKIESMFNGDWISEGQINRRVANAFGDAGKSSGGAFVYNFAAAAATTSDKLSELAKQAMDGLGDLADATNARVTAAQRDLTRAADYISNAFDDFFSGIQHGESVWESFRRVALNVIRDISSALLRSSIAKVLSGAIGGGQGALSSGIPLFGAGDFDAAGRLLPTHGFASGGSFKVGGAGSIDSKLIQFRATPGELVDVRKPGQAKTGATVTINNYASKDTEAQARTGAGGEMIIDIMRKDVGKYYGLRRPALAR